MTALNLTLDLRRSLPSLVFWFLWVAGTFAGGILYFIPVGAVWLIFALFGVSDLAATHLPAWLRVVAAVLCGAAMGLSIGLAQWLILLTVLKRAGWWVAATVAGYAWAGVLPLIANAFQPGWLDYAVKMIVNGKLHWLARVQPDWAGSSWPAGALTIILFGLVLGIAQWFVLRGRVDNAAWWILASALGWTLAALAGVDAVPWPQFVLLVSAIPVAIAGVAIVLLIRYSAAEKSTPKV